MLTHQSSPRVLLSDVEYLTLKIAFNPGYSALWYLEQLRKYAGDAPNSGPAYDFISGHLVNHAPGGLHESVLLALEVPTSDLKWEHLKGLSRQRSRGYVLTLTGLDIARETAVKIGIDPDTVLL